MTLQVCDPIFETAVYKITSGESDKSLLSPDGADTHNTPSADSVMTQRQNLHCPGRNVLVINLN